MNTQMLMTLTTLITLILCLFTVVTDTTAAPVATDGRAAPFSATRHLRLLNRLASISNDQWLWLGLRLVVSRGTHSQRAPP